MIKPTHEFDVKFLSEMPDAPRSALITEISTGHYLLSVTLTDQELFCNVMTSRALPKQYKTLDSVFTDLKKIFKNQSMLEIPIFFGNYTRL